MSPELFDILENMETDAAYTDAAVRIRSALHTYENEISDLRATLAERTAELSAYRKTSRLIDARLSDLKEHADDILSRLAAATSAIIAAYRTGRGEGYVVPEVCEHVDLKAEVEWFVGHSAEDVVA